MAAVSSSSKRKPSSHKKKSKRVSSEVKRKSRSKRRNTSKKLLRRRDASVSYSDDDSKSMDSVSISSSDSEDNYRSRRARSRTRTNEKTSKKRVRRISSSSDDSCDSPHRRRKKESRRRDRSKDSKKKGSNRKHVSLSRKKVDKRKRKDDRSRRGKSLEYASSDSRSCSTCRISESSSSEEMELERSKGKSEGRVKKGKRSSGKTSYGRQNYRNRSRSCSSLSNRSNEDGFSSEERNSRENQSRFMRSVIAKEFYEAEDRDYDEEKSRVDVIQDDDDYPCRSNDSHEGGRKNDFSHHVHVEKKRKIDDLKVEEAFIHDSRTMEFTKINNPDHTKNEASRAIDSSKDNDLESILRQKALEKFEASTRTNIAEGNGTESFSKQKTPEKLEVSTENDSFVGNDLESILRQKALENLKKFRGGEMNMKVKAPGAMSSKGENGIEQPSAAKANTAEKEADTKLSCMSVMEKEKHASSKDNILELNMNQHQHKSMQKTDLSGIVHCVGNSSSLEMDTGKGDSKDVIITNKSLDNTCIVLNAENAVEENSEVDRTITNNSLENTSDSLPVNRTQKSLVVSRTEPKSVVEKNFIEVPKTADGCSNSHVAAVSKEPKSCTEASPSAPLVDREQANEQQGVAKGSSEFEQKTMSVMRGGEMVQVSYKVYIPQKAPALARRKLRR